MKILVIYDSVYGNTEKIARAVASGLAEQGEVETLNVIYASPEKLMGAGLVAVGSPTRGFKPTEGMQVFLKNLPAGALDGVKVAAFDTRIAVKDVNNALLSVMVRIFGYAAKPMADSLVRKGGQLAAQPEGFIVQESEGPLQDGELERATAWAKGIRAYAMAKTGPRSS
jgi:flavodoxin